MKILIDNQVYENQYFGGISRYFNELQRDNPVIEKMEAYEYRAPDRKNFYEKLRLKINPALNKPSQRIPGKNEFYQNQLKDRKFDIFHPTYYDNYFLESLDKPFVLTVHDMIHEKYPEYFGLSPDSINKRRLCEKADKIIAISETTKKDLIEVFGTSEDKIEVIYHATNFESVSATQPEFDIKDRRYLLYTGNREVYKNFLTFLVAVAPILIDNKELILICTGPGFNRVEKKWITDLQLEASIKQYYCNNDNELAYLYRNAECFVFPSLYEGFGLPLLESFACECPVVSSSGGALMEIAGEAAVYFNPKNLRSIRESLYKVISDEGLKRDLINLGKKRLENFTWDKCRKATLQVYSGII